MANGATVSSMDMNSPSPRSDSPGSITKSSYKSQESLTSHPLLGDTGDEANVPVVTSAPRTRTAAVEPITSQSTPYAVPYKTRQRPASTASLSQSSLGVFSQPSQAAAATTTSASATSPLPTSPSSPSSLTNKLHTQNLQASVQEAGLTSDSTGWHMLQKILHGADKENEKDKAVTTALKALRTGKAALLLPREHANSSDISSNFLRDHILLKDGRNVTTLSGLRGVMADDVITFTSCVPAVDMKKPPAGEAAFTDLLNPGTPAVFDGHMFPSCRVGKAVNVHIPRQSPSLAKPGKPATRPRSLVNLFGGQRSVSSGNIASTAHTSSDDPPALAANPLGKPQLGDSLHATMPIPAWTVDAPLHSKSIAKGISASIATRIQVALDVGDGQLHNMVLDFVKRFHPSTRTPTQPTRLPMDPNTNLDEIDLANADVTIVTAAIQEFYHDARQRLETANRERNGLADALADEGEKEREPTDSLLDLIDVDKTLEQVEAFLCETLYDKLFAPASSMDRQDDESLSMRIAGLHMLDLTLEHLGIQTHVATGDPEADDVQRTVRDGLEEIIALCGKEFQKLQYSDCRTPLAKLNVLISVHKIIADCLEALPPITLKEDNYKRDASSPPLAGHVIEMTGDAKSLGGRSAPRPARTTSETSDMDKTPRLPASRPASAASMQPPAIRLHESSFIEPYQLSTPSEYIAEASEPYPRSELETFDTPFRATQVKPRPHNTTSADAILPLLIYAVVQANPVRLVSHVMFVQRFRADSLMAGEGEYCLCNMEAVRTFLMSCDVASLGLGTGKLISPSDLATQPVRIRQRAGQHLDNMVGTAVGSAGRVLGQAADIGLGGYRILGGLLARTPASMESSQQPQTLEDVQSVLAGGTSKPASSIRQAILRRGTNASLISSKTIDTHSSKETEMSDVKATSTSPRQDSFKSSQPLTSSATISSRLASLPGLSRLSAPSPVPAAGTGSTIPSAGKESTPGYVSGDMAFVPSTASACADQSAKVPKDDLEPTGPDDGTLATSTARDINTARRYTVPTLLGGSYFTGSGSDVSMPLGSPIRTDQPAQVSAAVTKPSQEIHLPPTDRVRSSSFMSHSHQYEPLNAANRPRSGSMASNLSGTALGIPAAGRGVVGAFGAVTNLVSNVRQAYSPSVSSHLSTAPKIDSPPIQRFLDCEADDLKMSEIALLLADYKRLAARLSDTT